LSSNHEAPERPLKVKHESCLREGVLERDFIVSADVFEHLHSFDDQLVNEKMMSARQITQIRHQWGLVIGHDL